MPVPPIPDVDDTILVKNNEVLRRTPGQDIHQNYNNVLMSHAEDESLFHNKEVLAGKIFSIVYL